MKSLLMSLLFLSLQISAQGFLPVAKISAQKGNPLVNTEKSKVDLEIAEGNKIELKRGEKMTITFQNGHSIKLTEATVIVETLNPKHTVLNLEKGQILVDIKELTPNEVFQVRSGKIHFDATAGQWIVSNNQKQTRLLVGKGSVQVQRLKEVMEVGANFESILNSSPKFDKKKVKASIFQRAQKAF